MRNFLQKGRKPYREPAVQAPQASAGASAVPEDLTRALEASADDLRNDRLDDTADFLNGMQRRIDEYFARRQAPGPR